MLNNLEYPAPAAVSLPGQPTNALPGSEEKLRVLTERAERCEPLFHPQDRVGIKVRVAPSKPLPAEWPQTESA